MDRCSLCQYPPLGSPAWKSSKRHIRRTIPREAYTHIKNYSFLPTFIFSSSLCPVILILLSNQEILNPCTYLLCPKNQALLLQVSTRFSKRDIVILQSSSLCHCYVSMLWLGPVHLLVSLLLPSIPLTRLFCLHPGCFSSQVPNLISFSF